MQDHGASLWEQFGRQVDHVQGFERRRGDFFVEELVLGVGFGLEVFRACQPLRGKGSTV